MKVIVLDNGLLFDEQYQQTFSDNGIQFMLFSSPDNSIEAFIKHPETELFSFFIKGNSSEIIDESIPRLRNINPLLKYFAVFEDFVEFESKKYSLEKNGILSMCLSSGPSDIVSSLMLQRPDSGARRSEHRVDCNLHAYLYEHDPLDQKLSSTKEIVSVVSFSANGAYVASKSFIPEIGASFLFEINLPDVIYLVKGRVVWVNKNDTVMGKPRGFAMQFCDMSKAPQDILKHMIEEELVDSILKKHAF